MTWRYFNGVVVVFCIVTVLASAGLWAAASMFGFIGSTAFIGHVSMAALVLGAAGMATGSLAAWRADVPNDDGRHTRDRHINDPAEGYR